MLLISPPGAADAHGPAPAVESIIPDNPLGRPASAIPRSSALRDPSPFARPGVFLSRRCTSSSCTGRNMSRLRPPDASSGVRSKYWVVGWFITVMSSA